MRARQIEQSAIHIFTLFAGVAILASPAYSEDASLCVTENGQPLSYKRRLGGCDCPSGYTRSYLETVHQGSSTAEHYICSATPAEAPKPAPVPSEVLPAERPQGAAHAGAATKPGPNPTPAPVTAAPRPPAHTDGGWSTVPSPSNPGGTIGVDSIPVVKDYSWGGGIVPSQQQNPVVKPLVPEYCVEILETKKVLNHCDFKEIPMYRSIIVVPENVRANCPSDVDFTYTATYENGLQTGSLSRWQTTIDTCGPVSNVKVKP